MKKSIHKLSLNKITISNLSNNELNQINGGAGSKGCVPNTWTCPSVGCQPNTFWCMPIVKK